MGGESHRAFSDFSQAAQFGIDNFDEAQTMLSEQSIKAEPRNEEGGQFLHFTDPDGTQLYFIKPKW